MILKDQRKRKILQDEAPRSLDGTNLVQSKKGKSVFILYDRESERDRYLMDRLRTTLHREDKEVKCSILSESKIGWVLKSYGEELEIADKVVVLFSADFLKSDEAMFVFEMARGICMEKRENKIIIASKSCRDLPKIYAGFPRVKMSKKAWIQHLVEEVKKPALQVSSNTWTYNQEGYKSVNVKSLQKECDNKKSTSMPTIDCLEQPPSLPKSVIDRIMIWNRVRKGPKTLTALGRAKSQKEKPAADTQAVTKIRKSSSFCKDRETLEFMYAACRIKRRSRRASKYTSRTSSVSNLGSSSPPGSPSWCKTSPVDQLFHDTPPHTPLSTTEEQVEKEECTSFKYEVKLCDELKSEVNLCSEISLCCLAGSLCKKKRSATAPKTRLCRSMSKTDRKKPMHRGYHANKENSLIDSNEYSGTGLSGTIEDFVKAMKDANQKGHIGIFSGIPKRPDLEEDGDGDSRNTDPNDSGGLSVESNTDVTTKGPEPIVTYTPSERLYTTVPVQYVSLPENPPLRNVPRRPRLRSGPVSNSDEVQFDTEIDIRPQDFRRVNFDSEERDFMVHRGDVVWLQTFKQCRTVSVRKRNGRIGRVRRILLSPYINCDYET